MAEDESQFVVFELFFGRQDGENFLLVIVKRFPVPGGARCEEGWGKNFLFAGANDHGFPHGDALRILVQEGVPGNDDDTIAHFLGVVSQTLSISLVVPK